MEKTEYFKVENINSKALDTLNTLTYEGLIRRGALNLTKAALVVLDVQKFFFSEKSHAFIPSAPAILKNINLLTTLFSENNLNIFFTRHSNSDENAFMMKEKWRDMLSIDSEYYDFAPELDLELNFQHIEKHQYDAFYNTDLEAILRNEGFETVVFAGVAANLCCETTVRSAFVRGFRPYLPIDATAANNYDIHLSTFRNLAHGFCTPVLTQRIVEELEQNAKL